ncbi:MAG: 5'-nucleotidase [Pseudanabaenaceae cyanobacterium]
MSFPIEEKLVVAIASSALFDLTESHGVFEREGAKAYRAFQEQHLDVPLRPGVAFPFIERLLALNTWLPEVQPVEVVLLSRNSVATGRRVFRSIQHYGLNISRAAFTEGKPPFGYAPAFNAALFLSANATDVQQAIAAGYPAGTVLGQGSTLAEAITELRIAFDFDGVIADDEAETVFKEQDLAAFQSYEAARAHIPHQPGPLADLFQKLAWLQSLAGDRLRTAIVTARSAPAHERVITTLEHWGVNVNEAFFLGGIDKSRILSRLQPHIFFDDQRSHWRSEIGAMVHIPFGIANRTEAHG